MDSPSLPSNSVSPDVLASAQGVDAMLVRHNAAIERAEAAERTFLRLRDDILASITRVPASSDPPPPNHVPPPNNVPSQQVPQNSKPTTSPNASQASNLDARIDPCKRCPDQQHTDDDCQFKTCPKCRAFPVNTFHVERCEGRINGSRDGRNSRAHPHQRQAIESRRGQNTDEGNLSNNRAPHDSRNSNRRNENAKQQLVRVARPDLVGLPVQCGAENNAIPFRVDANFSNFRSPQNSGVKPFQCDHCQKSFGRKSNLNRHCLQIHARARPFQCDYCQKTFGQKSNLKQHFRVHLGDKPFQCDYCQDRFNTKFNLKQHMRVHTGVKPLQCDHCQKRFGGKSHLKQHLRGHAEVKPFECDRCEKRFVNQSNLKEHVRVHTGEKPFRCDRCRRRYASKGSLKKHLQGHAGVEPF